ncbi:MAG: hypothetical protein FWF63_00495 [Fibromonadales bacterium]|nr:hypothetical protein [Fibromonadales bacterium]
MSNLFQEEEAIPRGFAAFLAQDKTATPPSDAMALGRVLPKIIGKTKPAYPPPELFEMPKYSEIVKPTLFGALKYMAQEKAKEAVQNTEKAMNDLEYMNPIPYDDLINEAVSNHLRKFGR